MDQSIAISIAVIIGRLLVPLLLLRFPVAGVFLNMIADSLDHVISSRTGWGLFGNGDYQLLDKALDTWYLFIIFLLINRGGDERLRRIGRLLFFWRFAGVILFELTGLRHILVFAPNIVEYFYLTCAAIKKWRPNFKLTDNKLAKILALVGIFQFAHEYFMHWLYPDVGTFNIIRSIF